MRFRAAPSLSCRPADTASLDARRVVEPRGMHVRPSCGSRVEGLHTQRKCSRQCGGSSAAHTVPPHATHTTKRNVPQDTGLTVGHVGPVGCRLHTSGRTRRCDGGRGVRGMSPPTRSLYRSPPPPDAGRRVWEWEAAAGGAKLRPSGHYRPCPPPSFPPAPSLKVYAGCGPTGGCGVRVAPSAPPSSSPLSTETTAASTRKGQVA